MFLQWAHATNSHKKVTRALENPAITPVECDVLLGIAKEGGLSLEKTPILAHPPNREGDCSVAILLNCMTLNEDKGRRFLKKHLKLDFKEIDVVEPSLELLKRSNLSNPLGRNIFLNADIFSGPGMRTEAHVRPDLFIEKCLLHIRSCKVSQHHVKK